MKQQNRIIVFLIWMMCVFCLISHSVNAAYDSSQRETVRVGFFAMDGKADAKTVPIIAMTANAFEEDRQHALAAGMNGHIAKPIEISKLLKTLAEIL